jgi:hypothetical protein
MNQSSLQQFLHTLLGMEDHGITQTEVAAFYWTVLAPDIVNSGQEEQGLVSV